MPKEITDEQLKQWNKLKRKYTKKPKQRKAGTRNGNR